MMYSRLTVNPVSAAWNTVARFDDYSSAQRAVDWLSDDGFPVEQLDIVGSDLRLVERVTGRLTKARAAAPPAPQRDEGWPADRRFVRTVYHRARLAGHGGGRDRPGGAVGRDLRVRRPPRDPRRA